MAMKRVFSALIILAMVMSAASCSKTETPETSATTEVTEAVTEENEEAEEEPEETEKTEETEETKPTREIIEVEFEDYDTYTDMFEMGVFFFFTLENDIPGVKLVGSRVGTEDDINGLDYQKEGIRCIFEINENIDIYIQDTNLPDLKAYVCPHMEFSDTIDSVGYYAVGDCMVTDLTRPSNADDSWGSLYVSDYMKPGYYDLVLMSGDTSFGLIVIRIFPEGELDNYSADLTKFMDKEIEDSDHSDLYQPDEVVEE